MKILGVLISTFPPLIDRCTSKGPNTERSVHLPRNEGIPWPEINVALHAAWHVAKHLKSMLFTGMYWIQKGKGEIKSMSQRNGTERWPSLSASRNTYLYRLVKLLFFQFAWLVCLFRKSASHFLEAQLKSVKILRTISLSLYLSLSLSLSR